MKLILVVLFLVGVNAWINDPTLQQLHKTPTNIPRVKVDLNVAPQNRWDKITPQFKHLAPGVLAYLETVIPKWALPIVETIGASVRSYFPPDYGDEMIGLAKGLGLKVGDIVAMNLIYQLESIGLNCSNWNNTGPTLPNDPGCEVIDPKQKWCYCHKHQQDIDEQGWLRKPQGEGPGLCTSIVAADENGTVYHGRNLDWNLPNVIRKLGVDVEFVRGNQTVFIGTTMVGFVGVLNGLRKSSASPNLGYSVSIDARGKGGKIINNLLEALFHHTSTPSQHLRQVFETADTFPDAVTALSTGDLVDEIYYISAGAQANQGVVISRDRNDKYEKKDIESVESVKSVESVGSSKIADQWYINTTDPSDSSGWFRLQTNYDHWSPVPKADDRRTPGKASMIKLGRAGLDKPSLLAVMKVWPVFNHHTDYTGLFVPAEGYYHSTMWMGDDATDATDAN